MSTKIKFSNCDLTYIVDDEDAPRMQLDDYWYDQVRGHICRTRDGMPIGRVVLNCYDPNLVVDHISGNRRDNQKSNLRTGTRAQNMYNRKAKKNGSSKHKSVDWRSDRKKWRARITVNGEEISLGHFDTEIEAAKAYNKAAKKYFGEFAKLNKI